jgi:hypothetical protein
VRSYCHVTLCLAAGRWCVSVWGSVLDEFVGFAMLVYLGFFYVEAKQIRGGIPRNSFG